MAEETRSGTLNMPLVLLESEVETQLALAQMALDLQQDKHARKGVLSAAVVKAYAQLALNHAQFADQKERRRFQEHLEMAVKLLNAYWTDFNLVLLKRVGGEAQISAEVREKPKPKHVVKRGRPYYAPKLTPEQRQEVIAALKSGPPEGQPEYVWIATIAEQYGIGKTMVRNYKKKYVNGH